MRARITKKKIAAVAATTTVVALGAGAAVAFWTSTGDGTGTAKVGEDAPVEIASAPVEFLYPGAVLDLTVTIQNPNPHNVVLANGVAGAPTTFTVAGGDGMCDADNFELVVPDPNEAIDVPAKIDDATPEYTYPADAFKIKMENRPRIVDGMVVPENNQDGCKNATVTINYVAN